MGSTTDDNSNLWAPGTWFQLDKASVERAHEVGPAAFTVYVLLAHCLDAKNRDRGCYPSLAYLSAKSGLRKRAVQYAIARLESAGWITVSRRIGTGNLYHLPPLEPVHDVALPPLGPVHQIAPDPCTRVHGGVHQIAPDPCTRVHPEQEEGTRLKNKTQGTRARAGKPASPAGLSELIDGWNALGDGIVRSGNGAQRDPPSKAALQGWSRALRDPEQKDALQDVPALLEAIRKNTYCHGKGWFTLPWLFGKNKNGVFNLSSLLTGAYEENGNGQASRVGPGQRYDPTRAYEAI